MLFIFDDSLDICIGDINDGNVLILECVNHACSAETVGKLTSSFVM
jgi:hypothetical protein